MKVACWIQGHPTRAEQHERLVRELAPLKPRVSLHASDPPLPWLGYQKLMYEYLGTSGSSHVLVLQDDVVVCRNLPRAVGEIAKAKPDDPVILFLSYLPRQLIADVRKEMKWGGGRYVRCRSAKFWPVVAVLWPRSAAEHFMAWTETARLPGMPGPVGSDDAVFGEWGRRNQRTAWVTTPSLVEHPDEIESLWKRRALWGNGAGRCALHWIGPDADPLELDWS